MGCGVGGGVGCGVICCIIFGGGVIDIGIDDLLFWFLVRGFFFVVCVWFKIIILLLIFDEVYDKEI